MFNFAKEWIINSKLSFNNDENNLQLVVFVFILYGIVAFIIYYNKQRAELSVINKFSCKIKTVLGPLGDSIREQRKKTHEFGNQMTIISGYLKNKDFDRARSYINKLAGEENIMFNNSDLGNVHDDGLRELLACKKSIIKKNHIELDLVIDDSTNAVIFENSQVFMILGVLIDNAIEGSLKSPEPYIAITKFGFGDGIKVIIENSIDESNLDSSKLYESGYSTKGMARGVGLSIVNDIISKNDNIEINTYVENEMFVQELIVSKIFN